MTGRVLKLTISLLAGLALLAPAVKAQVVTDTNIEIRQFDVIPSKLQAGDNPNVELFFRFCSQGLVITSVEQVTNPGPPPTQEYHITTSEPHGIPAPPQGQGVAVRIAGTTNPNVNGFWATRYVDADTFALDTTRLRNESGDMRLSPGPRAQLGPDFGCIGSGKGNEVQNVTLSGNPTGTGFTLTFMGTTTPNIPYGASDAIAAQIQSALEALPTIGPGNVTVTFQATGFGPRYTVTFRGVFTNQDQPPMTATKSPDTTPVFARVDVTEFKNGSSFEEKTSKIKDFRLQLPPGFLGNPTATAACPEFLWEVQSCPDNTLLGHAVTIAIPEGQGVNAAPLQVRTGIFNVATMGLSPARLGTNELGSTPPGPFPIVVSLRTLGDYGIDSALINIPKTLGGPQALAMQIYTVLCAQVPCKATDREDPASVVPLPPSRPFFRNPTSCTPKESRLNAVSWAPNPITVTETDTFTPTGCGNVPFDASLEVLPTESKKAGDAGAQTVAIDYCNEAPVGVRCLIDKGEGRRDYADDPLWQSALKDADVRLPEGMTLSPGGGVGLDGCDFEDFGVTPPNSQGEHKQLNNDAPACPPGSQIGTINVATPVLPDGALSGKVFFGCNRVRPGPDLPYDKPCLAAPGRPTPAAPWKLFLLIEGAGLRIKLAGDVDVADNGDSKIDPGDGQIHNLFVNQPEVPFTRLEINLRGGDRAILANPDDCNKHDGAVSLTGWSGKTKPSTPTITPDCNAQPFQPNIDAAGANPEQAGANTTSYITISRGDGQPDIKNLKLSLPVGAVGSLSAVPKCPIADAQAGSCSAGTRVGTVKTTVGTRNSLLTTSGSLYLAEPSVEGDAATLALVVPAKVGPIDLGQVVVMNRVMLRPSDTGVDAVTSDIPSILGGVPLHVRKIEITVDRPGFFINPTGCEPRPLTATFNATDGQTATSTIMLNAKGCENLSFAPKLRLIAGAKGQNAQLTHPPLTAIVTQGPGEANIKNSEVILPDLLRPNSVQFNVPDGLCEEEEFAIRACPEPSHAGTARVITPVLPFQLSGPVYVVRELGSVLPKLYVVLRGQGLEVVLRARNSFLKAIRTINNFDNLPDVPQAYFELKIDGGPGGILNNHFDACGAGRTRAHREFDYTFTGQNGKQVKKKGLLEQPSCGATASALGASISSKTIKVNRKGVGKLRVRCQATKKCSGRVTVSGKGVKAGKKFSIGAKKSKVVKLKFSKKETRKIRKTKRLKSKASAKVGGKTSRKNVTLVPTKR